MLHTQKKEIVIKEPSAIPLFSIGDIVEYRHMLWSLVWRNLRLQFQDMYLGFFWTVARPLAMVAIFTLLKRGSGANMYVTISYPLYVFSGLVLWFHFIETTTLASGSVIRDAGLIKKIYFPRIITPLVPVLSGIYNLLIALVPVAVMMMWFDVYPDFKILLLPVVILQCMLLSLGVGCMFAALTLTNNDFSKFLNLILYLGLFVSPVIFSADMIPKKGQLVYFLNPMAGTLLAFRSCLFKDFPFPVWQFSYSVLAAIIIFLTGNIMYRKTEIFFADKL